MTEYEEKLEELRGICEWLQEHGDEVDEQDGAVIIAFELPGTSFKACISVGGHRLKLMALHMAVLKCMEKNAVEDDKEDEDISSAVLQ